MISSPVGSLVLPSYGTLCTCPRLTILLCQDALPEECPVTTSVASLATCIVMKKNSSSLSALLHKVSDFNKLFRITMIVLRWKTLIKSTTKNLITSEIARKWLVKAAQRDCFQPFISSLANSNDLPKRSPLAQLSPILDSEGILRVGGRLARANVPFEFKHPHNSPVDTFTEADLDAYGTRRYRKIQYLAEQFWTRWRSEHLHQLTLRRKWQHLVHCFAKGDVVLVRNPLAPHNHWETGVITKVIRVPIHSFVL